LKIKSQKDFWSGLMFVVLGVGFAWGATAYSFGSSARPGPAYFPFGLGVLTACLGGLMLFKALTIEVEGGDRIGPWPDQAGCLDRRRGGDLRSDAAQAGPGLGAAHAGRRLNGSSQQPDRSASASPSRCRTCCMPSAAPCWAR
jgi:hypothetical protein